MIEETVFTYGGTCSCGWGGPTRLSAGDADADVLAHCKVTGCRTKLDTTGVVLRTDDLMPHERAKLCRGSEGS